VTSRKDVVLAVLRAAIIEGRLAPGARLEPDRIAAELRCSRMPVREALKVLEQEGLVTCYPFRGTEVSQLRAADVEELFAMRIALERLAVTRAVASLSDDDLADMRRTLTLMDDAGHQDRWIELNYRFHHRINRASGWPRLVEQIDILRQNVERYIRVWVSVGGYERPQRQHWDIFHACEARDAVRAADLVERHQRDTAEMLLSLAAGAGGAPLALRGRRPGARDTARERSLAGGLRRARPRKRGAAGASGKPL
jgi:DNA-binding GntR family transcriptional regulator